MPFKDKERERKRQREKYRRYLIERPFWQRCVSVKSKCQQHKLAFNLTPEFLESIWTGKCFFSDLPIELVSETRKSEQHAELDRIIPSKGYVQSNVIWVSRRFNRIKADGTADEHRLIAEKLSALRREYGSPAPT